MFAVLGLLVRIANGIFLRVCNILMFCQYELQTEPINASVIIEDLRKTKKLPQNFLMVKNHYQLFKCIFVDVYIQPMFLSIQVCGGQLNYCFQLCVAHHISRLSAMYVNILVLSQQLCASCMRKLIAFTLFSTFMVEDSSHVKQLYLNHACKSRVNY